jgi:hypothetical protein
MFQDLRQTFWQMTMENSGTFSPNSLNIGPCDIDLFLKMNDSSHASSSAVWRGLWKQELYVADTNKSQPTDGICQHLRCGTSFTMWQEITLMAGNGSFQVNKAVMYVQHILPLLFTHLHTLAIVKTT